MRHPAHADKGFGLWDAACFDPLTGAVLIGTAAAPTLTVGGALTGLSAIAGIASAAGSIMSGNAEASAARFQAGQMKQQAGQERAVAQRQAIEQRRQAGLANSRVTALAAASGGGATDTSVLDIEGDNAAKGEYNALTALYQGEEKARGLEMGVGSKLYEGSQARRAGLIGGGAGLLKSGSKLIQDSSLMSSGSSLLDKYGNGGFRAGEELYPSYV